VPAIWGNVPQRNKNFTGRVEILDRLRQDLRQKSVGSNAVTAVLPHALRGMGGVGKSAVAIEYAWRYRSEYDLVWWIPADQPALVRSSLAALAGRLGLQASTPLGIEAAASAVMNALRAGQPYRRWLLVFDNADRPEDLNEIIPSDAPGDVIITSRNHRWESVVDTVTVDVFTRPESTAFLIRRVAAKGNSEAKGISEVDAGRLAEELGDLPLALEQAAALQAETGMSVDEYLRLLREQTRQVLAVNRSPEYPLSMTAAWKVSVAKLSEQLPQALELLRCCAFFGPEPIPRDLFHRGLGVRLDDLLNSPILLARVIAELGRFALLRIEGRNLVIHRLIQALLRDELAPEEQAEYRHEVHVILAKTVPQDPDDTRQWPRFDELVAHVSSRAPDLARCGDPEVRDLALRMVRYLTQSGDHASARQLAEQFITRWTLDLGDDDADVLGMQRLLGDAFREMGRYTESYALSEAALRRAQRKLGERHRITMILNRSLAADLRARGDFAGARAVDEESLRIHEQVLGADDPQTWRVMNNLAIDYSLTSDYSQSLDLHQRAYQLRNQAASGVSASDVVTSWGGLARALRQCGRCTEACDLGEDALSYSQARLGAEHFLTLRIAKDLCIARRWSGTDPEAAVALGQEIYDLSQRLFPGQPDTLAAAVSLVNLKRAEGKPEAVLELAEATLAQYAAVYGQDHPYTLGCVSNLAILHRVTGSLDRARAADEAALASLQLRLGRDHDYSLSVAVNLASDWADLGEHAKARELGEDCRVRLGRLMGDDDPLTLGCTANLACDLRALGEDEQAAAVAAGAWERMAATLGRDSPDVIAAREGERIVYDFDPPPV
jgi:tetratricopeptide (TPR) repeat protein